MVACEGDVGVAWKRESDRMRSLLLTSAAVLFVTGLSSCRGRSPVSSTPQTAAQPVAQQAAQALVETDDEKSCREFVQGFYDWYAAPVKRDQQHRAGVLSSDDVLRFRPYIFDARLFKLLKEDRDVQSRNPGYITGLESDPFFNSQDPMPKYQVQSVTIKDGHCRALVQGVADEKFAATEKQQVEPELALKGTKWIFVNFHYPDESYPWDNLIDELIWLRNERSHPKK